MSPRNIRGAACAAALSLLTVAQLAHPALAATGRSAEAKPSAGARGIGDPYFPGQGNGGIDVRHYDITFAYDPATKVMDATTKVLVRATQNLDRFNLDFRGPKISSVTVDSRRASYRRDGQELVVTPRTKLRKGRTFTVEVKYKGTPPVIKDPDGSLEGWIPTKDGAFVPGEPQGAPAWFPGNDHPTDKATFTFHVTVPKGITAVGNGRLVSQRTSHGRTTFVWSENEPMATYLATVTLGKFDVKRSRIGGLPVYVAVDPALAAKSKAAVDELPDIIRYYSSVFGRYPFSTVGAIVDDAPNVGYALESQTKPIFSSAPSKETMAHELAHQWFGDDVSPRRWSDIWLNEGWATYAQWMWSAHNGGPSPQKVFDSKDNYGRPASDAFWQVVTANPGTKDMFGDVPYNRGAMTLQALRRKIGDRAFFRLAKEWLSKYRYSDASTKDFTRLAERVSHKNLDKFFQVWLYQKGKPTKW
ncbi:M1 family metallopeptidase [Nonomuraea maritima]|nr:M1 family metallopeptidase [Nonomuraea maritima]